MSLKDESSCQTRQKKDKDVLKKVKYESVDRRVGIQSLYFAMLTTLGFTLLLEKPKKQKTKTLPLIQLYQIYDESGSCVFDRDSIFEQAKQMNIGKSKMNSKRTVRQFVANQTVNTVIQLIESNNLVDIKEGRSKRNIVNDDIPQQRKIESLTIKTNGSSKRIDLNQQALSNGKLYHEALLHIFDDVQCDGIILDGNQYNIGFVVSTSKVNIVDSVTRYFQDHRTSFSSHTTFVPLVIVN
ncbi:hypothetical protein EIN_053780 [Entamoeba invadens IP1]|uniref:hypothetical protein n=1 Tax=Entamoeba invadens IP1 TaxID=370355 RepID=UPI0002C3D781|nr:hypothetical protein EIN_053780 [Entamoeba invadens IP1]ELP93123.1 hypothetical protein EIN_053780 [Entamoeba invadens IP1]|eukprot:XP_004259894.1 hypothetical protein EIN_053780 [Entamoeba invadens IP1]